MMDLQGKVVIITGGASNDIAKAIAFHFLTENAKVALCDSDPALGKKAAFELSYRFGEEKVIFFQGDTTSPSLIGEAFISAKKKFGQPIKVVVNIARFASEVDWDKTVDIDLKGVIRGSYLAIEHMGRNRGGEGGTIINVASILGLRPLPFLPSFSAVNSAIITFTRCLADEAHYFRTGVRILGICLGKVHDQIWDKKGMWTDTEFNALTERKTAAIPAVEAAEVAAAVVTLTQEAPHGAIWQLEGGAQFSPVNFRASHENVSRSSRKLLESSDEVVENVTELGSHLQRKESECCEENTRCCQECL